MWWVFCSGDDDSGLWVSKGLRECGLAPLEVATCEHLATAVRWEHRISNSETLIEIELRDGRTLRSDQIAGVVNRMTVVPSSLIDVARADDRDYALQEFTAFFMSWLHSLPGTGAESSDGARVVGRLAPSLGVVVLGFQSGLRNPGLQPIEPSRARG